MVKRYMISAKEEELRVTAEYEVSVVNFVNFEMQGKREGTLGSLLYCYTVNPIPVTVT